MTGQKSKRRRVSAATHALSRQQVSVQSFRPLDFGWRTATSSQPTGTVTFLFSDIEGSTRLWESNTEEMRTALQRHDEILRTVIERMRGYVFKTVGDAFCAAFSSAPDAIAAAAEIQTAVRAEPWKLPRPIRVRIALHTGEAEIRDDDYFGPAVNRTARLESLAFGGQTILSLVTEELVRDNLPRGAVLHEQGSHRLKDLTRPESVFELRLAGQDEEYPQLKSLDAHIHNLPLEPTPLIGREHDLARLAEELLSGHSRLLTLVGPGGIGKTRMALQLAADVIDAFPDGAFVVDLTTIRDPNAVPQAIVETLKVSQTAVRSVEEQLVDYLAKRRMVLVLDNFEQVIEGGGEVAKLLARCGDLKVIVTSREALHLRGEHVFHVPTLGVPEMGNTGVTEAKHLSQYESVRLFIDRAVDQNPDFAVTRDNAPAIAEICVRLDGLPLAIELAAARVGLLSPEELLQHLSARLKLLTGGPRDLPGRQQTLRKTIDWSFDLLSDEEKRHFAKLSVFAGGFSMNACERVCIDEVRDLGEVLQLTQSLVDKSLIVMSSSTSGSSRFRMLETIREYGMERLHELPEVEDIRKTHAGYFLAVSESCASRMEGAEQRSVFEAIDNDLPNIRAAAVYFAEYGEAEKRARVFVALGRYWQVRAFCPEGRAQLESAIESSTDLPPDLLSRALTWGALLAREQGDYETATALGERALAEAGEDVEARLFALHEAGWTAVRRQESGESSELFGKCRMLAHETGSQLYEWKSRLGEGATMNLSGGFEGSRPIFEEAQKFFHAHEYPRLEAQALGNLGWDANALGDTDAAVEINQRLVPICEEIGDVFQQLRALNNLSDSLLKAKNFESALESYERCRTLARRVGNHRLTALAAIGRAEVLLALERAPDALAAADDAVAIIDEARIESGMEPGYTFKVAADFHLAAGNFENARELYRRAIASLEETGDRELLNSAEAGLKKATERSGEVDGPTGRSKKSNVQRS